MGNTAKLNAAGQDFEYPVVSGSVGPDGSFAVLARGAVARLAILPASQPGDQHENTRRESERAEHPPRVLHCYSPSKRRPNQTTTNQNAVPLRMALRLR